ncbi:UvrD-helicase domain-containing protein [Paenibacillus thalictri]|uniref:ATP-dependent helicase/nuclease subunit A n=1 Tax=Paenibacillus thalictri TaxID=2527873 RepID=A0A4V2J385_9BACL|nr:UvrD-helicase domain-containing protein [Paenibacillus thalictri]TBL70456.1 ATP-dependent helicase [Paenibacillus thalictri]
MKVPKPADSKWTDDQWDAITLKGRNLLVAAAAGSGKTAVLVERIIRRISDEEQPVDVDRLLVATFTKAAAAEMRQRIREALEKTLASRPESEHLRRQLALMGRASITTLHSFCLDVIRRHYQLIRLDPGFRIANETESELLRQDVLDELLEEWYGSSGEDSHFWRLVDSFSGERSDEPLYRLIQRLYDFSRSHPWPDRWLKETSALFGGELGGTDPWKISLLAGVRLELAGAADLLGQAMELAGLPGGPAPYLDNLREDQAVLARLTDGCNESWEHAYRAFQDCSFGKLKAVRGDACDKSLQEQVKELRNRVKEQVSGIQEELFGRSPQQFAEEMQTIAPLMEVLTDIVCEFAERYRKAKADKSLVDFADLEHYCLQILCGVHSAPDHLIPSPAALDYREQFEEVLLDEYQDTNRVQEAIVELISRPAPGNRFMVGDVKQSIYRFRLAEPGLFLEKYKSYDDGGAGLGQRIDLARNFRSRREVVDAVNYIFRQLMNETVGEINYDNKAELVHGAKYYPDPAGAANDCAVELLLIDRSADAETGSDYAEAADESAQDNEADAAGTAADADPLEGQELDTAQLEARVIASHIRRLLSQDGSGEPAFEVFDTRLQGMRPATYRDIVILLRATQAWSPIFIEELRLQGIPAYAELNTGYFSAVEVEVAMSLLKVIDNPYQDIPLASVLRSAIVGLSAEELAQIRIGGKGMPFYEAVKRAAARGAAEGFEQEDSEQDRSVQDDSVQDGPEEDGTGVPAYGSDGKIGNNLHVGTGADNGAEGNTTQSGNQTDDKDSEGGSTAVPYGALRHKLRRFLARLDEWRTFARSGALSDLLWTIYRETGYYDFVGAMPGGVQRQANLRALYDRARQYEATSLRGLFRFLRFIERMKETGGDLGTARALGEQEDVVRIMSIHKSKGLEFPVVFVAGLAKMFNQMDLNDSFLLHKELGFGPRFADTELRVGYPTLPALAIRRRLRLETLAEEMRVLYVALTRPREKLFLLGTVKGLDKRLQLWGRMLERTEQALPDFLLAQAKSYLDWIGPAAIRHPHGRALRERAGVQYRAQPFLLDEASRWQVRIVSPEPYSYLEEAAPAVLPDEARLALLQRLETVPAAGGWGQEAERRLSWSYAYEGAHTLFSKTSVTELKRIGDYNGLLQEEGDAALQMAFAEEVAQANAADQRGLTGDKAPEGLRLEMARGEGRNGGTSEYRPAIVRRPRFLEQKRMNAAERGTLYHAVMQHIPLTEEPDEAAIRKTLLGMTERQLITMEQSKEIDPGVIAAFFRSEIGQRLLASPHVRREIPFSYGLAADEVYAYADETTGKETILIQGVIDCLFEEPEGIVLIDFKTDTMHGTTVQTVRERYRLQLHLYARAIEHIWKRPVVGKYLYLFDGSQLVDM